MKLPEPQEANNFDSHALVYSVDEARQMVRDAVEAAAQVCDTTPPHPFRPSIEAAWAIRKMIKEIA